MLNNGAGRLYEQLRRRPVFDLQAELGRVAWARKTFEDLFFAFYRGQTTKDFGSTDNFEE
jgi:hypothetical protein